VYHGDSGTAAQVRGTRNPPLVRKREAQLHESVAVHGAHRGGGSCARDTAEPNVAGITVALARKDVLMLLLLFVNSTMAYFVNLTNFLVTKHTSALSLQVLGNGKGAVAVVVSDLLFRNPVSVVGMLGYSLSVFGVFRYIEAKRRCK
jgi:hypothetical protein